ncbi:hypothetical protein EMIHUDRAFT_243874 [Emiliania huxleyi CCMP1516]|uniref:Uncharacterized protein n=2 Tax=Emiliania huxleyi TaxID=2903 RepID=A0A0D3IPJ8_EMIH1|nr:hypothetical protein EMIHUDRAFT_212946 [Emiliania huxleyi CCMP1516]XP_005770063.1 hypothetical protein EMIHUDRAFT_243874 [Emiliania huxleyi CCMP1516]EOD13183.1 hypothetical protein EMIHUDRAFT_212946 [Emiliania huxleyi CCMP1516]EOD17634.1 hypothetical protein EMIHUDRAFT_243874 [Emiliania huxleyi CCMP1516]|eukprot:XP_005765612.1 hypothetical protein EMIHUDRAFT_212946 [Emiliania huxleyi CCMP1516]
MSAGASSTHATASGSASPASHRFEPDLLIAPMPSAGIVELVEHKRESLSEFSRPRTHPSGPRRHPSWLWDLGPCSSAEEERAVSPAAPARKERAARVVRGCDSARARRTSKGRKSLRGSRQDAEQAEAVEGAEAAANAAEQDAKIAAAVDAARRARAKSAGAKEAQRAAAEMAAEMAAEREAAERAAIERMVRERQQLVYLKALRNGLDAIKTAAEAAIAAMAEGEDDAPRPSVAALRASFAEAGASPLTPEQIPTRASWSSAGRWQSRVSAGASAGVGAVAALKPVPRSSSFGRSTMSAPDSAAGGVSALKAKFAGNSLRPGSGLHRHLLQAGAER